MTGSVYPSRLPASDEAFVNFTCSHRYPLAIRRIVDNCFFERMSGVYVSSAPTMDIVTQDELNLTATENQRPCAMQVWRMTDTRMTAVYRVRYNKLRSRYQFDQSCVRHTPDTDQPASDTDERRLP